MKMWCGWITSVAALLLLAGCGSASPPASTDGAAPSGVNTGVIPSGNNGGGSTGGGSAENHAPLADAGAAQTVTAGAPVVLHGSGSDIEDGSQLIYRWSQSSGTTVMLSDADTPNASFTAPAAVQQEVLGFTLSVIDRGGLADSASVAVTVQPATAPPNQAPAADAGADQVVQQQRVAVLDGSASRDAEDGTNVSFAWSRVSGLAVQIQNANSAVASFTAPPVNAPTQIKFRVVVTDRAQASSVAETAVTVTPLPPQSTFIQDQCAAQGGPASLCGVLGQAPLATGALRLPVLSYPVARGALQYQALPAQARSVKTVDGNINDWIGTPSLIGGTARMDAGEFIYSDFLFDAYGADDGDDAQRLATLDPLAQIEPRTFRFDQLAQAAGDQFDAPRPVGAPDRYGDTVTLAQQSDLSELRWAADAQRVYLLARTTTLTDATKLGVLVLLDTAPSPATSKDIGFGSGLTTQVFDTAILLTQAGARVRDLASGSETLLTDAQVAVNAAGWNNALEAGLPARLFAPNTRVAVIAGPRTPTGLTPANLAFRFNEPVAGVYNDKLQALSLRNGNVDAFAVTLKLAALRAGVTEGFAPGPGYHERQMISGDNISIESPDNPENGRLQPYGLYIPTGYDPAIPAPLTFWLHYRGGKAHSGAAWTPRLISELGERRHNIVATPRGRGTSTWYVTQAHQDFFEVFRDLAGAQLAHSAEVIGGPPVQPGLLNVDAARVRLSGYSMGGYGTYLFGLLYPDLFSSGFSTSGAMTQGAWTGVPPDSPVCATGETDIPGQGQGNLCFVEANDGDANAQLTYRLLDNARWLPIMITHGSNDELVPVSGVQAIAAKLAQLGFRYDLHMFFGYEHYTQAIIDEWGDGGAYLNQFARPENPRRLTYKISPALVRALNTVQAHGVAFNFNPNRAYWASGLALHDARPDDPNRFGQIDAESLALAAPTIVPVPRVVADTSTPVFSPNEHSTPYARHGLDWVESGSQPLSNAFNLTLTNLSAATLDAARMALKFSERVDGAAISDGNATLRLANVATPVQVFVNGILYSGAQQNNALLIPLVAGVNHVVVLPPGAAAPVDEFGRASLSATCRALGAPAAPVCAQLDAASTSLGDDNLHTLIVNCREQQGPELLCKTLESTLYGIASACRAAPEVPKEFCALINGQLIAQAQMVAYENGWIARALGLQRTLGDTLPLHNAEFPHTHNSFNSTTANFPQTLSGSDSNQKYSIRDQLRMGIRAIEVDIHWMPGPQGTPATAGREAMVCHGNVNHAGCTAERPLTAVLAEIRAWLEANPGEIILLYLEEHLDEAVDDQSVSFKTTTAVIENAIGPMIFRPADHGAQCNDNSAISDPSAWINLSRARIRNAGKRLLIFTGSCGPAGDGATWAALAHNKRAAHYVEAGEASFDGYAYPGCKVPGDGAYSTLDYATKLTRFYEDSTLLAVAMGGPTAQLRSGVTVRALREMVRCGVNLPGLDQVTPDDPRLASYVWSWAGGEPAIGGGRCALHRADGRFIAADCAVSHAVACRNGAGFSLGAAAAWTAAGCAAGSFSAPLSGNENETLIAAKAAAGVTEVWLNYSDRGQPGDWRGP